MQKGAIFICAEAVNFKCGMKGVLCNYFGFLAAKNNLESN